MNFTPEELSFFRETDTQGLLYRKKLHLVLDLDHTLVHTKSYDLITLEDRQRQKKSKSKIHENVKGRSIVKFRPGVFTFLKEASTMFDMSIYTMGNLYYARYMASLFEDRSGNMFRFNQVLSRETCPTTKKEKTLELVLSDERVVLIVDDTKGVWKDPYNESNLVTIGAYQFWTTDGPNSGSKLDVVEDEETMDDELARVLRTLRSVHGIFYGCDNALSEEGRGEVDCSNRDVREILKFVRVCEEYERDDEHEEVITRKRKRSEGVLFEQSLHSCVPAKRYKTCNVVDFPCSAC